MTIYVDSFLGAVPKRWVGGGHMTCSNIDELHAMAAQIGLKRAWFQDETFPHYDLTANKRAQAIAAGAHETSWREIPDDTLVRCPDGTYETYGERMERGRRQREESAS